jgi:dephospho-CoA kinase
MTRALRDLRVWGLTGGIGSGKSTVARMFAERGVPVIDADALSRAAQAPGEPAHADIAAAWPEVVAPDGTIDRRRLARIVFQDPGDPTARLRLEAIMHPRIQTRGEAEFAALAAAGHRLVIYEASLLLEAKRQDDFDGIIVVNVSPATQLARVLARGGISEAEAKARIAAQLPLAEKVRHATAVIDNDGDLAATEAQVGALLARLTEPRIK